jgi:simple sugar transport system ATP-binding protein
VAAQTDAAVELRGITKRFPGVVANRDINIVVRRGQVHAVVGENGAGKSTLMKILYGMQRPDEGSISVDGKEVSFHTPGDAIEAGIGMVHQHFMLADNLTVLENVVLGSEPTKAGVLDFAAARRRIKEISDSYGLDVSPDPLVEDLGVGDRQRVEILKVLYRGAKVLILDEPTAVLVPQEVDELFENLRELKNEGLTVIFISHKLNEVLEIADRITVLRRGKKVDTIQREGATEAGLARMMVGRDVLLRVDKQASQPGETLLDVTDLHVFDERGLEAVRGVSLSVRTGEIVAIAGVDGNGQTELIDALTGLRKPASGRIVVGGREMTRANAHQFLEEGVGHIPEDRHRRGLVLEFSLAENLVLHDYAKAPYARSGFFNPKKVLESARGLLEEFDVRGGNARTRAAALSGGNQQKVVIAREVSRDPRVLIAAQPTRGLDVGAIEFVHRRLIAERDAGRGVLLFSLELEEVRALADRILVIYEGQIVGEFPPDVSEEELGVAMTGGGRAAA